MKAFLNRHPRARRALVIAGILALFLAPGHRFIEPIVSAAAQGISFVTSPTGNELVSVIVPNTGGNQGVSLTQIRDAQGYSKQAPLTGTTIAYPNSISRLILIPAGTLAALTITMPTTPVDGAEACFFSTQTLTSLTMNAAAGQTLNGALTSYTGNATAPCWGYSASNKTWDRSQ